MHQKNSFLVIILARKGSKEFLGSILRILEESQ